MDKHTHTTILTDTTHSMSDFPSEIDRDNNLRLYDESSLENHLAILSHHLHSPSLSISPEKKAELLESILEFLESKAPLSHAKSNYAIDEECLDGILRDIQLMV